MNLVYQKTLKKSISFRGIGLHTGQQSDVKICPAPVNHGIVFKRIDLNSNNLIPALYNNVSETFLCTKLKNYADACVSTVEHLLAALYLTGVDNALIEINAEEVPIMDGSAKNFVELINNSGLEVQKEKIQYLFVTKELELKSNKKFISIRPSNNSYEIEFMLNYDNKVIGKQKNKVNLFDNDDVVDIYSSRTFCLLEDIEKIKAKGLAKGGSLDNAIVVDEISVLNKNGLRNTREFVNHKILDMCGDFYLSGHRIIGDVNCIHGGHQLSCDFIKLLKNDKNFYTIKTLDEKSDKKVIFTTQEQYLATA